MKSNARRFIDAYNKVDNALRSIYGINDHTGFSDMIRRLASKNYLVKLYEEELVSYARLRNAIVHKSTTEEIIAEPHDEVVENIEKIARLVCIPPTALEVVGKREVICLSTGDTIYHAIFIMNKYGYSNIPVMERNKIVGVLNNKSIISAIGRVVARGLDVTNLIKTEVVERIITEETFNKYYLVMDKKTSLPECINQFSINRKLLAIFITENGSRNERPISIITGADVMQMNEVLDNY